MCCSARQSTLTFSILITIVFFTFVLVTLQLENNEWQKVYYFLVGIAGTFLGGYGYQAVKNNVSDSARIYAQALLAFFITLMIGGFFVDYVLERDLTVGLDSIKLCKLEENRYQIVCAFFMASAMITWIILAAFATARSIEAMQLDRHP